MRQHAVIIDVEENRVGFAKASCSYNPLQITSDQDLLDVGQKTALSKDYAESADDLKCDHSKVIAAQNWWKPTKVLSKTVST